MVSSYHHPIDGGASVLPATWNCSKLEGFIQYGHRFSDKKEDQRFCRRTTCKLSPNDTAGAVGRFIPKPVGLVGQQARQEKSPASRLSAQADHKAPLVEQPVQTCLGWSLLRRLVNLSLAPW